MFSTRLTAFALIAGLAFASCSKDKDDASPSYGSVTFGSETVNFSASQGMEYPFFGYILLASTTADTSAQNAKAVNVQVPTKPTSTREYTISDSVSVTYTEVASGVQTDHEYGKAGQKVQATVSGGKVKFSFTNLTETEEGADLAGGKSLSGSISEK